MLSPIQRQFSPEIILKSGGTAENDGAVVSDLQPKDCGIVFALRLKNAGG